MAIERADQLGRIPGEPKINRRKFLKIGLGGAVAAALTAAGAGQYMQRRGDDEGQSTISDGGRPQNTPVPSPESTATITPSPTATPEATSTIEPSPTATKAATYTATSEPSPTASPTEVIVNPELTIEEMLPYDLYSKLELSKENGDLQYFSHITFGVEEGVPSAAGGCGSLADSGPCATFTNIELNPKAYPDLPEEEGRQKCKETIEEVLMIAYLNALQMQDSAYEEFTVDDVKQMVSEGTAPSIIFPKLKTENEEKSENVEVDLFNQPLFINAVSRVWAGDLYSVQNINFGFRGINKSAIMEMYRGDGFYQTLPGWESTGMSRGLYETLITFPDLPAIAGEHIGGGANINPERVGWENLHFDGKDIFGKLVPNRAQEPWEGVLKAANV